MSQSPAVYTGIGVGKVASNSKYEIFSKKGKVSSYPLFAQKQDASSKKELYLCVMFPDKNFSIMIGKRVK